MTTEIVTHWAHVRLTLGVDLSKYLHVLVPCQPNEEIDMVARFTTSALAGSVQSIWMDCYRGAVTVAGLELIYDRGVRDTADLISIIHDSLAAVSDKRVMVISSDDSFLRWLVETTGYKVECRNASQTMSGKRSYLTVKVTEPAYED